MSVVWRQKVKIKNNNVNEKPINILSISGSSLHFHCSFVADKVSPHRCGCQKQNSKWILVLGSWTISKYFIWSSVSQSRRRVCGRYLVHSHHQGFVPIQSKHEYLSPTVYTFYYLFYHSRYKHAVFLIPFLPSHSLTCGFQSIPPSLHSSISTTRSRPHCRYVGVFGFPAQWLWFKW